MSMWRQERGVYKTLAFVGGAAFMAWMILMLAACSATRPPAQRSSRHLSSYTDRNLERVYFTTDSDKLNAEAIETLGSNRGWLARYPRAVLVLEGHCDERGDAAYNVQLGDRRARQVKAHLIASGIDPQRLIMVVSHGELRPVDKRHNADAWRQNRRVEFIVR